jgi:putative transposase
MDMAPRQVHATLLDELAYFGSVSTMYRALRRAARVSERRALRRHPSYARPELVARAPNEVWSWDITKVRGPGRRDWLHLYVMIDIYSRKVVGWMLAAVESAKLAEEWIRDITAAEGILGGTLTIHADRGTAMRSKTVAELFDDLDIARSHSRPRVSNDNPYSEAAFKTLKYHWSYPGAFAGVAEGREYFALFFRWYNTEHRHSGIAYLTPDCVHEGQADVQLDARQRVLDAHFAAHPERFVRGLPKVPLLPADVWINRPDEKHLQMTNVEDETSSSALNAQNQATEARPSAAGPPAQGRAAPAEGVAAMAEPTGRVPPGTTGAR